MNSSPPEPPVVYRAFRIAFRTLSHLFFREIQTTGAHNVPSTGPCIFIVGPHANQFTDGMVFLSRNPRHSYVLMASVSYNRPLIGHVGKILSAIPVVRPQDIVHPGTGFVSYEQPSDPFTLHGHDTCFTRELHPRDFVIFGRGYKAHVAQVLSDTSLVLTHPIPGMETMTAKDKFVFRIVPHVDQTHVYREVHAYLEKGECITVFPEGGSHDRPEMLPLKAGFAVMALGAMAENPDLDIKIVPVGLNYFHPDRFRSRAVVSFAPPFSIDKQDVEKFKRGGKDKREAVTHVMDISDEAFKTVTINAPDYDTLMVIKAARRLYQPSKTPLEHVVQLNRNFALAWTQLKDDPELQALTRKVKLYNDTLSFFGIKDHQVYKLDITPMRALSLLIRRLLKLSLIGSLGAPALIMNLPLIWMTETISRKKQREALAGSLVKIAGTDVLATWKIIVATIVAPLLYGIYALLYLAHMAKKRPDLTLKQKLQRATIAWAIQPILNYVLLRLGDTGLDIYKSIKPLFLAVRNPEVGRLLRVMRADLSKDVTAFVNKHSSRFLV